jgi:hypothetical protein
MKVKFYVDSGANIHSQRSQILDTVKDLGMQEGEWESMPEDERHEYVDAWVSEKIEQGYEEIG